MTKAESEAIKALIVELRGFRDQYETDMRGNNKVDGDIGFINEMRKLKELLVKYPTLTYLFATSPFKTVGAIVAIWIFLQALYTAGLMQLFAAPLGIKIP